MTRHETQRSTDRPSNLESASARLAGQLNLYHWRVLVAAQHELPVARGSLAASRLDRTTKACLLCARDELASLPTPLLERSQAVDRPDQLSDLGIEVLAEFQLAQPEWFASLSDAIARRDLE